jgi:hypothetical protein
MRQAFRALPFGGLREEDRSIPINFVADLRGCVRSSVCIDQIWNRFAQPYSGEAARRFWGWGYAIAQNLRMLALARMTKQQRRATKQTSNKQCSA